MSKHAKATSDYTQQDARYWRPNTFTKICSYRSPPLQPACVCPRTPRHAFLKQHLPPQQDQNLLRASLRRLTGLLRSVQTSRARMSIFNVEAEVFTGSVGRPVHTYACVKGEGGWRRGARLGAEGPSRGMKGLQGNLGATSAHSKV